MWVSRRLPEGRPLIDNFSLGLSHGLMMLAALLLLRRPDLDREPSPQEEADKPKRRSRFGA